MGKAQHIHLKVKYDHWIPITYALEVIFKQVNIAGNRSAHNS
ncbi:hypothetical protein ACQKNX_20060 [Lysinibacillus sp. NPDC093712]